MGVTTSRWWCKWRPNDRIRFGVAGPSLDRAKRKGWSRTGEPQNTQNTQKRGSGGRLAGTAGLPQTGATVFSAFQRLWWRGVGVRSCLRRSSLRAFQRGAIRSSKVSLPCDLPLFRPRSSPAATGSRGRERGGDAVAASVDRGHFSTCDPPPFRPRSSPAATGSRGRERGGDASWLARFPGLGRVGGGRFQALEAGGNCSGTRPGAGRRPGRATGLTIEPIVTPGLGLSDAQPRMDANGGGLWGNVQRSTFNVQRSTFSGWRGGLSG